MKLLIRILAVSSISALGMGCSLNRAESLRMLDQRADYDSAGVGNSIPALKEGGLEGFNSPVPVRTRAQVATCWIFAGETRGHDYFWGGWISLVTDEPGWILTKPGAMPKAPGFIHSAQASTKKLTRLQKKPAGVPPVTKPAL